MRVVNLGGTGAPTTDGIKIVDVGGASNGTFSLQGNYVFQGQQAVIADAYAYTLQKNGVTTPADGDWYLRSALINPPPSAPAGPLYQPGVPLYENYAQVLLGMNSLPTMQQRVGDRYWDGSNTTGSAGSARERRAQARRRCGCVSMDNTATCSHRAQLVRPGRPTSRRYWVGSMHN